MKAPVLEYLFNKVAELHAYNFIENKTPTQVFTSEYCEFFKNSYFEEDLQITASEC